MSNNLDPDQARHNNQEYYQSFEQFGSRSSPTEQSGILSECQTVRTQIKPDRTIRNTIRVSNSLDPDQARQNNQEYYQSVKQFGPRSGPTEQSEILSECRTVRTQIRPDRTIRNTIRVSNSLDPDQARQNNQEYYQSVEQFGPRSSPTEQSGILSECQTVRTQIKPDRTISNTIRVANSLDPDQARQNNQEYYQSVKQFGPRSSPTEQSGILSECHTVWTQIKPDRTIRNTIRVSNSSDPDQARQNNQKYYQSVEQFGPRSGPTEQSGILSECRTVWTQIRPDRTIRNTIRVSNSLDPDQARQNNQEYYQSVEQFGPRSGPTEQSGILSECQAVWTQIRPDRTIKRSGLFWVKTVCKCNQQTTTDVTGGHGSVLMLIRVFSNSEIYIFINRCDIYLDSSSIEEM